MLSYDTCGAWSRRLAVEYYRNLIGVRGKQEESHELHIRYRRSTVSAFGPAVTAAPNHVQVRHDGSNEEARGVSAMCE